jgi:Heterokaryon incompatibility protein (HET)
LAAIMHGNPFSYHRALTPCRRKIPALELLPSKDFPSTIQARLHDVSLDKKPDFSSSVVCIGDPNDTAPIEIDEKTLHVTKNCNSALRYLRHSNLPTRLWVDATCIDQHNVSERSQQVL